ncbi:hypothetical protein BBJ28_00014729 [Nothophytophthora sp. Chile5]|nr:hypothetical protein BBJ28_00014729 [Nothophytophthora sp. Chile5]
MLFYTLRDYTSRILRGMLVVDEEEGASIGPSPPEKEDEDAPDADTLLASYMAERDVDPMDRVMQAASTHSLHRTGAQYTCIRESEKLLPARLSQVEADLGRLVRSTTREETRQRLEGQLESLRQTREQGEGWDLKHLQIAQIEENPLEFRRDCHGVAVVQGTFVSVLWSYIVDTLQSTASVNGVYYAGRNVLGEHYAPRRDPLRFARNQNAAEVFQRMKRIVREDLRTRNQRRIAALNAKEQQKKRQLGIRGSVLTAEQQLEMKLDRLFEASPAS